MLVHALDLEIDMRLRLFFLPVIITLFSGMAFAQQYDGSDIEVTQNGGSNTPRGVLGPIAPRMDKEQIKIRKHYLDIGLVTVVSVSNEIIAVQFNSKITPKDKSYGEMARVKFVTYTTVIDNDVMTVWAVFDNGQYIYSILYNKATRKITVIDG